MAACVSQLGRIQPGVYPTLAPPRPFGRVRSAAEGIELGLIRPRRVSSSLSSLGSILSGGGLCKLNGRLNATLRNPVGYIALLSLLWRAPTRPSRMPLASRSPSLMRPLRRQESRHQIRLAVRLSVGGGPMVAAPSAGEVMASHWSRHICASQTANGKSASWPCLISPNQGSLSETSRQEVRGGRGGKSVPENRAAVRSPGVHGSNSQPATPKRAQTKPGLARRIAL